MNERTNTESAANFQACRGGARSVAQVGAAFVCGVLAACALTAPMSAVSPAAAIGQSGAPLSDDEGGSGRVSAAEQRKEMIVLLKNMSTRMDRIEAALAKGLNVKVINMPALGTSGEESRETPPKGELKGSGTSEPKGTDNPTPRMSPKQPITSVRPKG
jgi:hypothetical protein